MPRTKTKTIESYGENINHFNAIRVWVTGSGNLKPKLYSLSDVKTKDLSPIVMEAAAYKQPTVLTNFSQQRAALELKTTEINETFAISRIIIFAKPVATSYPQ